MSIETFDSLNLHPSILKAVAASGYTKPTPIQAQAIPLILEGKDLLASAQTGTGKTAGFTLPALNFIAEEHPVKSRGPRILVLVPTRELAAQVNDAARQYGKFLRARTVSIVGGMPYPLQNKLLSQPVDILVATPGRFIDHLDRGRINLDRLQMLILDEADRMLDMGFMPDIQRICEALPVERQTLLFTATLDSNIRRIAKDLLNNPETIEVAQQKEKHANIEQRIHHVDDMSHKNKLLEHILIEPDVKQAIVFTSTKRHADVLSDDLYAAGHRTASLHGDMNQGARNRTIAKVRRGDVQVLVATDVAARGIDVQGISHVINYDLPKFAEDYVHRIGRTGRAGNKGIAISFASNDDRHILRKIEQYTGQNVVPSIIEGLEPKKPIDMNATDDKRGKRGKFKNRKPSAKGQKRTVQNDNRGEQKQSLARRNKQPNQANEEVNGNSIHYTKDTDMQFAKQLTGGRELPHEYNGYKNGGNKKVQGEKFGKPRTAQDSQKKRPKNKQKNTAKRRIRNDGNQQAPYNFS